MRQVSLLRIAGAITALLASLLLYPVPLTPAGPAAETPGVALAATTHETLEPPPSSRPIAQTSPSSPVPDVEPGPESAFIPLPAWMAMLKASLEGTLETYEGDVAIAVTDLETGEAFSINGRVRHLAGCTIKLPMLVATLRDVEEGRYALATIEKPMLDSLLYRVRPDTSNLWLGRVGIGGVNEVMRDIGMYESVITHPPFYYWLQEPGYLERENILTAEDINLAFVRLYRGELLTEKMTDYALLVLTNSFVRHRTLIARLLPADVTVIHKIGYIYPPSDAIRGIVPPVDSEAYNDAGIVIVNRGGREASYSVAILTQGNPDHFGEAGPFAARLSRTIYDAFVEAHFE